MGTGGANGFHPRLGFQAFRRGFPGDQAGTHHDRRVGGVGAGGDGGDRHHAVVDRVFAALRGGNGHRVGQAALGALGGGFPTTGAGGVIVRLERAGEGGGGQGFGVVAVVRQVAAEGFLGFGQENPVLGAFRAGDGRHHGGQVEFQIF